MTEPEWCLIEQKQNHVFFSWSLFQNEIQEKLQDELCEKCEFAPCIWEQYGVSIVAECQNIHAHEPTVTNSQYRKTCYQKFSRCVHGYLGKGNRRELPECVLCNIREMFPNKEDEKYMGFK